MLLRHSTRNPSRLSGPTSSRDDPQVTPHNIVDTFTRKKKRSIQKGMSGIVAVLVGDAKPNPGISEEDEVHLQANMRHFSPQAIIAGAHAHLTRIAAVDLPLSD